MFIIGRGNTGVGRADDEVRAVVTLRENLTVRCLYSKTPSPLTTAILPAYSDNQLGFPIFLFVKLEILPIYHQNHENTPKYTSIFN